MILYLLGLYGTQSTTYAYLETIDRLASWGNFLLDLCSVSTLMSLVDIALGVLRCSDRMRKARPTLQWATYTFGFILAILSLTVLVKDESYNTKFFDSIKHAGSRGSIPDTNELRPFQLLSAVSQILLLVGHVAQLALSIFVITASQTLLEHRKVRVSQRRP